MKYPPRWDTAPSSCLHVYLLAQPNWVCSGSMLTLLPRQQIGDLKTSHVRDFDEKKNVQNWAITFELHFKWEKQPSPMEPVFKAAFQLPEQWYPDSIYTHVLQRHWSQGTQFSTLHTQVHWCLCIKNKQKGWCHFLWTFFGGPKQNLKNTVLCFPKQQKAKQQNYDLLMKLWRLEWKHSHW